MVKTSGKRGHRNVELTIKGHATIEAIYTFEFRILEPAFWDGKWRVVIFDIRREAPENTQTSASSIWCGFLASSRVFGFLHVTHAMSSLDLFAPISKSGTGEMLSFAADAIESDKKLREHSRLA